MSGRINGLWPEEAIRLASLNYEAQEKLIEQIRNFSLSTVEQIAAELEVSTEVAQAALDGQQDLTLTELRYLANAAGLTIRYEVVAGPFPDDA